MCEAVIEFGREGYSLVEMASALEVTYNTIRKWELDETKPEFTEAMAMARTHSQAWWERWGRENIGNSKANAAMWMKNMGGRFKEDWSDRQVTTLDATDAFGKLFEELNGRTRGLPQKPD